MDITESIPIFAKDCFAEILKIQNTSTIWYYGISIPPENPSSMASLLGIESLNDLFIFYT